MSQNATREEFKGDFLGFTFDDYHSSVFGIVRTSQSNRYNENLLPTMQDKTVQVPGGDGAYYFGSYYTQRQFTINFAFDSMTEKQLRRLREVFGDRKIHDLIFDEVPYKIYSAKCTGTPQIKYLCFDEQVVDEEGNMTIERRYKGEGTLQFTAYYPFARGRFKFLEEIMTFREKDLDGNIIETNKTPKEFFPNLENWAVTENFFTRGKRLFYIYLDRKDTIYGSAFQQLFLKINKTSDNSCLKIRPHGVTDYYYKYIIPASYTNRMLIIDQKQGLIGHSAIKETGSLSNIVVLENCSGQFSAYLKNYYQQFSYNIRKNTNTSSYETNGASFLIKSGIKAVDFNLTFPSSYLPLIVRYQGKEIMKINSPTDTENIPDKIRINSKNKTLEGINSSNEFTGEYYNNLLTSDSCFFKLEDGAYLEISKENIEEISEENIEENEGLESFDVNLEYDYLYY